MAATAMTVPERSGQAAAAAGRTPAARVPAVPVAGGIPTPNPPFRASPRPGRAPRPHATLPTSRRHDLLTRAADCLPMVVGRGHRDGSIRHMPYDQQDDGHTAYQP